MTTGDSKLSKTSLRQSDKPVRRSEELLGEVDREHTAMTGAIQEGEESLREIDRMLLEIEEHRNRLLKARGETS